MPKPLDPRYVEGLARFERWRELYGHRVAEHHPDVATEIESTVRERFLAGNFAAMTAEDLRHCLMRVASRMRVKGTSTPAGNEGSGAELRKIVDALTTTTREQAA